MKQIKIKDFDLKSTIESGQFFYFELIDDFYYIVENSRVIKIKQIDDLTLIYDGVNIDENYIKNFFGLNDNLEEITSDFKNDKYLKLAKEKYFGIRSQNLDLFQTIISFICSSASNISKIKKNIRLISKTFGEKIEFDNITFFTFPTPDKINSLEKLIECKVGYRAKYILETCKIISKDKNLLENIKSFDYENAKKKLMMFPGVGSKVADCICLFALEKKEVFPIDTWVKQIIEKLYLKKEAKNLKEISDYIKNNFGENKGIKQQYLFHWARHNLK